MTLTAAIWIVAHLLLWAVIGLSSYVGCHGSDCGVTLGLTGFAIGVAQLFYGVCAGLVVLIWSKPVAQGLMIGAGVTVLLLTVLCFGVSFQDL